MPCLFIAFGLIVPRVTLFVLWLIGYSGRAFETILWPLLGFFIMPYTTCAYAIGMNENGGFKGWSLILLIVGIVLDLTNHGGTERVRRTRRYKVVYTD